MKKIYFIALTLLLGIAQSAWADTTGNWQEQENRDTSWGSDYSTSDAFTISTAAQLAQLASMVNAGKDFSGKTITLAKNIDLGAHYWTPIGSSFYKFLGTFDGAGHTISGMYINENRTYNGLFGYIYSNAIIKNLGINQSWINARSNVTGTIVGFAYNCKILNCFVDSSVTITSTLTSSGNGEEIGTGGLVGRLSYGQALWGCVCGARVHGTDNVGGLVGEELSTSIVACLYTGNYVYGTSDTQAALFGRIVGGNEYLYHNLYTDSALDGKNGQDRRGYVISIPSSGVTFDFASQAESNVTYDVSGITLYTYNNYPNTNYSFITYNGTMYCAANQRIPFTVSAPLGYVPQVTASAGTLTQEGKTYSLQTEASDCTLSVTTVLTAWGGEGTGTEPDPYLVKTPDDLRWIAAYLNAASDYHYSGKYFKLDNDIAFDGTENNFTTIGNTNSTYFAGTFDGQGHTISGININKDNGRQGLFGTIGGGTIKNVTLSASTITLTTNSVAAGIVAYINKGTTTSIVENCHVTSDVSIDTQGHAGGIAGYVWSGETVIQGCTSAVSIILSRDDYPYQIGGIIGHCGYEGTHPDDASDITVSNCLYYGSSLSKEGNKGYVGTVIGGYYANPNYGGYSKVTFSNNYYTYPNANVKGIGSESIKVADNTDNKSNLDIAGNNAAVCAHVVSASEADIADMGTASTPVGDITPYANGIKYDGTYYSHVLALENNGNYTSALSAYAGQTYNVKLRGRTLYKDGCWNTLCLPFDFPLGRGIMFADASKYEVKELDIEKNYYLKDDYNHEYYANPYKTGVKNGRLYLFFKKATSIEAGKPYIVKWEKVDGYDNHHDPTTYDYFNPTFENVTISNVDPDVVTSQDDKVSFVPNYAPVSYGSANRSILFVGIGNSLYYPSGAGTVSLKSFRAYFKLNGVLMPESPSGSGDDDDDEYIPVGGGDVKAFVLDIEDDATSLNEDLRMKNEEYAGAKEWYSLDGIRLNGMPSLKGIYVTGGRKVVIK